MVAVAALVGVAFIAVAVRVATEEPPPRLLGPQGTVVYVVDVSGSQDLDAEQAEAAHQRRLEDVRGGATEAVGSGGALVVTSFAEVGTTAGRRTWDLSEQRVGCHLSNDVCGHARSEVVREVLEEVDKHLLTLGRDGRTDVLSAMAMGALDASSVEFDLDVSSPFRILMIDSDFVHTQCPSLGSDPAKAPWDAPNEAVGLLQACQKADMGAFQQLDKVILISARMSTQQGLGLLAASQRVFMEYCRSELSSGTCEAR